MYKSIYLKRGKEESLKRFHPWVLLRWNLKQQG